MTWRACEHPPADVVRVSSAVEWCGQCGAYRVEEIWKSPMRECMAGYAAGLAAGAAKLTAESSKR